MAKPTAAKKQPTDKHLKLIEQMASQGHSIPNICKACNISKDLFYVWREKFPEVNQALELGREKERHDLHNVLYQQAMEKGNITAAIFLLKSRHGYKEGDQSEQANRVAITFNLPAPAEDLGQYMKIVSPKEIEQ
ncbi:hypothetical protein NKT77_06415 [Moraxella sp. FZLJ2107]|uniref:hypothetical protein n=1 Tax=unclassified Moraxella TaxID=2685852 RepID=UPI0020C8BBB8|nr:MULTISPECIES: hypothetical protein [unclassified Moraxella]UTO04169.1 hypothetical protein NKT77_06415 [Moraxella sp. FZLJ2107]UTO23002.1 hypothetical protein NKU06_03200 [Moraxella sp. FZLJ2109]